MTIKFLGHVQSIGLGHLNSVRLELVGQSSVCQSNPVILEVSKGEAEIYRPGMAVEFTIIPRLDSNLEMSRARSTPPAVSKDNNATYCPKCGESYLSIPRMGISHVCKPAGEKEGV